MAKSPKVLSSLQSPRLPFNQSIVTIHEALFESPNDELCCQRSWVCALTGQRHEVDLNNIRQGAHQHVQMRTELLAPLWKFNFKFHKKYFPSVVKQSRNFCYSFPLNPGFILDAYIISLYTQKQNNFTKTSGLKIISPLMLTAAVDWCSFQHVSHASPEQSQLSLLRRISHSSRFDGFQHGPWSSVHFRFSVGF